MRRSYIKRGDKTTNGGVVLDGLERCLHHGTELSYLEAKVYCPRCKGVGTIAPHGPRRPGTLMGRRAALEGDLCLCRCDPPPHLATINRISANALPNVKDPEWQEEYHDPNFYSGATASIEQGVAFYPWKNWADIPQRYIDSTMIHETGHQFRKQLWTSSPQLEKEYREVIAKDGHAPSEYARKNANEDFSETANMYWSSKGTPCEEAGRERYPERYKYFDKITR